MSKRSPERVAAEGGHRVVELVGKGKNPVGRRTERLSGGEVSFHFGDVGEARRHRGIRFGNFERLFHKRLCG